MPDSKEEQGADQEEKAKKEKEAKKEAKKEQEQTQLPEWVGEAFPDLNQFELLPHPWTQELGARSSGVLSLGYKEQRDIHVDFCNLSISLLISRVNISQRLTY